MRPCPSHDRMYFCVSAAGVGDRTVHRPGSRPQLCHWLSVWPRSSQVCEMGGTGRDLAQRPPTGPESVSFSRVSRTKRVATNSQHACWALGAPDSGPGWESDESTRPSSQKGNHSVPTHRAPPTHTCTRTHTRRGLGSSGLFLHPSSPCEPR